MQNNSTDDNLTPPSNNTVQLVHDTIPWHCSYTHDLKITENFHPVLLGSENVMTHRPTLFIFGGSINGDHQGRIFILQLPSISRNSSKQQLVGDEKSKLLWEEITLGIGKTPPPREFPCVSYDKRGQLVYLFGGFGATYLNDVWKFDLKTKRWHNIKTTGEPPSPRCGCSGIYSPFNEKLYVFGGYHGEYLNDFYELDLETRVWERIKQPHSIPTLTVLTLNTCVSERYFTIYGGYNGQQYVNTMYHFDFHTREWKTSVSKLVDSGDRYSAYSRGIVMRGSNYRSALRRNHFLILHHSSPGSQIYEFDEEASQLISYPLPDQSEIDGKFICEMNENTVAILGNSKLTYFEIRKLKSTKDIDYFIKNLKERIRTFSDVSIF